MTTIRWLMAAALVSGLVACGGDSPKGGSGPAADAQATPKGVAEAIFEAARSGKYAGLAALIDTEADGDSKRIGDVAKADEKHQAEFKTYFEKGTVSGEPTIEGDKAAVPILFGLNGKKPETFNLIRRNGKWYLQSF